MTYYACAATVALACSFVLDGGNKDYVQRYSLWNH
jgi:hypothetical protein